MKSTNISASSTLQTEGLGISFGDFHAVKDVSITLEPGARQALIGPNGAGKTTLINLLTGVYKPTAGRILFGGQDITYLSCDQRARMGLVRTFQINTLFPHLTPLESVVLAICGAMLIWEARTGGFRHAAPASGRLRHTMFHVRPADGRQPRGSPKVRSAGSSEAAEAARRLSE